MFSRYICYHVQAKVINCYRYTRQQMVELNVCICSCGTQLVKSGNICYDNSFENLYFIVMFILNKAFSVSYKMLRILNEKITFINMV